MIRRLGIGCALVAALALPAGALAEQGEQGEGGSVKNAARQCKALRTSMGADAFREEFGRNKGKRNAFGKCVSLLARKQVRAFAHAVAECKAAYVADPAAFMAKYGSEEPANASFERSGEETAPAEPKPERPDAAVRAAMKRCVDQRLAEKRAEHREALEKVVKQCKEELQADRDAFLEKYGENDNLRNAFGKCVSSKVRRGVPHPESRPEKHPEPPADAPTEGPRPE